jgi:selenide,water dikinase
VLGDLTVPPNDRVLVDFRTSDDAGVYKLDEHRALVQTVDFFTPVVDDPVAYGRIAAANALSDVYAMGGRPLTALAIAGFPKDADREVLSAIFHGGLVALREAGVALLGGHTVQDEEIKFGYAVTGEVEPEGVWSNGGATPGDVLILTKPLGTGVITTAIKFGRAPQPAVDAAIAAMTTLNRGAAAALTGLPRGAVHACTDITGFGLIGHATEMAKASGAMLTFDVGAIPLLPGALELVAQNTPGGARTNREHFAAGVSVAPGVDEQRVALLFDPQTSGGLLAAVGEAHAEDALARLSSAGVAAFRVGTVGPDSGGKRVAVTLR